MKKNKIFYILIFICAIIVYNISYSRMFLNPDKLIHTAIIDIKGPIIENNASCAKNISISLYDAFHNYNVNGIILRINSPGGSPVQSHLIFNCIKKLKYMHPNKKIYSVIEEIGTSGAYLIASATDCIYSDPSSLVGSIGVKISNFGFTEIIKKIGIERRLYTSGSQKSLLDPFLVVAGIDKFIIEKSLNTVHNEFIKCVEYGRGKKLNITSDIFTGRFWTGREAFLLGLIDGFADIIDISVNILHAPLLINYTYNDNNFIGFNKYINNFNNICDTIFNKYL